MADSVEIRFSTPGSQTLGQARNEIKELKKALAELVPGTKQFADQAIIISGKQTQVNKAMQQTWSESAKMKESYFRAGLEVRQLALSSGLLSGSLGKLADGMSASVMNATQLHRALVPLGIQMSGIGIGAVAAVSVLPSLVEWFINSGKEAKKAAENIKKLNAEIAQITLSASARAATRLSEVDPQKALQYVDERVKKLREAQEIEYGLDAKSIAGARQRNFERDQEINNLLDVRVKIVGDIASEQKRLTEETEKYEASVRRQTIASEITYSPYKIKQYQNPLSNQIATKGLLGASGVGPAGRTDLDVSVSLADRISYSLQTGAKRFSDLLIHSLIEGNNLAKSLGMFLLGVGLDVASTWLSGGLTKLLGLGAAPTGGPVLAGQSGASSRPAFGPGQLVASGIVRGTDLALLVKINNPVLATRGY